MIEYGAFGNNFAIYKPNAYSSGIEMRSEDYHLVLPSSKPPNSSINDQLLTFESGNIVVFNPGDIIMVEKGSPTKPYLSVLLKQELVDRVAQEMDFSKGVRFNNIQNIYPKELLQIIKRFEMESKRTDRLQLMLDCYATQIVVIILREFESNLSKETKYLPDSEAYINLALDYIYSFFNSNISLEDICKEVNVSQYHFSRVFKQKVGVSPHQFLLNVRIKKAAEMLLINDYSIAETAELCGFLSLSHFSSLFKKCMGCTATEYRKNN